MHVCRGRHVVFTGQFSVPSMGLLVEELYSTQDYGFPDFNLVLLSPEAPSDELKRLLKTHKQSHRMLYLQGSCMNNAVSWALVCVVQLLIAKPLIVHMVYGHLGQQPMSNMFGRCM